MSRQLRLLSLVLVLLLLLTSCVNNEPIKVGFSATLTGVKSELGISIRNAFLMKVDEVNNNGGINGRQIEVIIKDDENDLDKVASNNKAFIDEGVAAIFGYEFSSKVETILSSTEGSKTIVMSPSISTYAVSGIDDNFFRTIASNYEQGEKIGEHANNTFKSGLVIYDQTNEAFAEGVIQGYKDVFKYDINVMGYSNSIFDDVDLIVEEVNSNDYDHIMYVTNGHDAVYITQYLYRVQPDLQFYSSNWGLVVNALNEGGQAVEGMIFTALLNELSSDEYKVFEASFIEKYNSTPEFSAIYSYEAATMLFEAMENAKTMEYEDLKQSLIEVGPVEGLISPLAFDEYGDIQRETYLLQVNDGVAELYRD